MPERYVLMREVGGGHVGLDTLEGATSVAPTDVERVRMLAGPTATLVQVAGADLPASAVAGYGAVVDARPQSVARWRVRAEWTVRLESRPRTIAWTGDLGELPYVLMCSSDQPELWLAGLVAARNNVLASVLRYLRDFKPRARRDVVKRLESGTRRERSSIAWARASIMAALVPMLIQPKGPLAFCNPNRHDAAAELRLHLLPAAKPAASTEELVVLVPSRWWRWKALWHERSPRARAALAQRWLRRRLGHEVLTVPQERGMRLRVVFGRVQVALAISAEQGSDLARAVGHVVMHRDGDVLTVVTPGSRHGETASRRGTQRQAGPGRARSSR